MKILHIFIELCRFFSPFPWPCSEFSLYLQAFFMVFSNSVTNGCQILDKKEYQPLPISDYSNTDAEW